MTIQHLNAASQSKAVDDMARRLVQTDVRYCVSSLIFTLHADAGQEGSLMSDDDAFTLAARAPDVDDYCEADRFALIVRQNDDGEWEWGEADTIDGTADTELEAWQAAYDATHQDYPEGQKCLEHWLVTDDLARRLREKGEAVANDIAGLTVWGRCTSGQAIYADAVIQSIARDILEA